MLRDKFGAKDANAYLDFSFPLLIPKPSYIDLFHKYDIKIDLYLYYAYDHVKARLYMDSMLGIVDQLKKEYKYEYAKSFYINGAVLMSERKYEEAFKSYYFGREFIKKEIRDNCKTADLTGRLGYVKYGQGKYLEAIHYFKDVLEELDHCPEKTEDSRLNMPQSYLNSIGLCFEHINAFDSAIIYYNKGLALIDREATPVSEKKYLEGAKGVIYGNLGGTYAKLKNEKEAEKNLKKSIELNDRPDYIIADAQTAKIKLARLYIEQSRFPEAEKLLGQVKAYLTSLQKKELGGSLNLKWHKLQWMLSDKKGDINKAYIYLQQYRHLEDSTNENSNLAKYTDLDKSFRQNEQEYNLELLKRDTKLKSSYLLIAGCFLLVMLFVLVAIWRNRKQLRLLNTKIIAQNLDLYSALDALQQSQEENTRMMKIVAHDLRSPLTAAISITELLLQRGKNIADDRELLELMNASNRSSLDMVENLLNVNTTTENPTKEPVEMHRLLRYCVDLLKFKAGEKKQEIILKAPPVTITVNRERIWRVMSNLIMNAIKFSPAGFTIEVELQQLPGVIRISVSDRGIGIPEQLSHKIFDVFTEARRPGTAEESSYGLGLAISRQIVESHGGRIWFINRQGGGTVFYVELPHE